ncbi:MAG: hypothetical protein L6U99_11230 [Clostridium sp.]|nr:MAG: hypothetical protein L6U99_11230 [Clostridium sp.]
MQDNSKRVKAIKKMKENTYQTHHLDRFAKPYFYLAIDICCITDAHTFFVLMFF